MSVAGMDPEPDAAPGGDGLGAVPLEQRVSGCNGPLETCRRDPSARSGRTPGSRRPSRPGDADPVGRWSRPCGRWCPLRARTHGWIPTRGRPRWCRGRTPGRSSPMDVSVGAATGHPSGLDVDPDAPDVHHDWARPRGLAEVPWAVDPTRLPDTPRRSPVAGSYTTSARTARGGHGPEGHCPMGRRW